MDPIPTPGDPTKWTPQQYRQHVERRGRVLLRFESSHDAAERARLRDELAVIDRQSKAFTYRDRAGAASGILVSGHFLHTR